jgi:hypothetical protein
MVQALSTQAAIIDLGNRWIQAELRGDADGLERVAARDFTLVGPVGFVLDHAQWIDRYQTSGGLQMQSLDWNEISIREYGDAVVVIGVQTQRATYAGKPADGRFRVTQVCVRDNGTWKFASMHFSPIGGPPPFRASGSVEALAVGGGER